MRYGPGCLMRHGCSGRRRARLWGRAALCARGRRPARESSAPRASLGASSRSPARPRRHHSSFARNSPPACSNIECVSLGLQRFRVVSKSDRGKLCAKLVWAVAPPTRAGPTNRPKPAPRPGPVVSWRLPHGACCAVGLAPTLPRVRYKILPARLLGGENGTKLSLHAEKAPNWAISGVLGEFCTGSGAVRLVLGEFCTEGIRCGCCWANNVLL